MESNRDLLAGSIAKIKSEIKTEVLDKNGFNDFHIGKITFVTDRQCAPGYREQCEYYGNDDNGEPIIVCSCVPI